MATKGFIQQNGIDEALDLRFANCHFSQVSNRLSELANRQFFSTLKSATAEATRRHLKAATLDFQ